jgi:hypothetical protein
VEAAKLAPRYSHELALVYERERQRGNKNRAMHAVARKRVAYMLAVERKNRTRATERRRCRFRTYVVSSECHEVLDLRISDWTGRGRFLQGLLP